jgi:hypothetical protein
LSPRIISGTGAESDVHRVDSEAILRSLRETGKRLGRFLKVGIQEGSNITEIILVVVLSEGA